MPLACSTPIRCRPHTHFRNPARLTYSAWCALQVASFLSEQAPIQLLQPCFEPWRGGLLSLDGVVARLSELLPPTFEELQRDFAVGVVTADGEHVLVDQGPLPQAVAASAAIPFIFSSVDVPGGVLARSSAGCVSSHVAF